MGPIYYLVTVQTFIKSINKLNQNLINFQSGTHQRIHLALPRFGRDADLHFRQEPRHRPRFRSGGARCRETTREEEPRLSNQPRMEERVRGQFESERGRRKIIGQRSQDGAVTSVT